MMGELSLQGQVLFDSEFAHSFQWDESVSRLSGVSGEYFQFYCILHRNGVSKQCRS